MPRLENFKLKITTGAQGLNGSLKYSINGFPLGFEEIEGGAGPGETAVATGSPQSFPHTLVLNGPEDGAWDIASIEATYHCQAEAPYTVRLGSVTLDHRSDLNIWHPRPAEVFDV